MNMISTGHWAAIQDLKTLRWEIPWFTITTTTSITITTTTSTMTSMKMSKQGGAKARHLVDAPGYCQCLVFAQPQHHKYDQDEINNILDYDLKKATGSKTSRTPSFPSGNPAGSVLQGRLAALPQLRSNGDGETCANVHLPKIIRK